MIVATLVTKYEATYSVLRFANHSLSAAHDETGATDSPLRDLHIAPLSCGSSLQLVLYGGLVVVA